MAGTKSSGRPGGNPEIMNSKYQFSCPDKVGTEPMELLTFRVEKDLLKRIKSTPGWRFKVRSLLREEFSSN